MLNKLDLRIQPLFCHFPYNTIIIHHLIVVIKCLWQVSDSNLMH